MQFRTREMSRFLSAALLSAVLVGWAHSDVDAQQAVPPPIVLGSPVACSVPEICWAQNYFDHDPGPGAEDHTCGRRAYQRHFGIDFRVANLDVMREGISVIAAADGVVAGTRDGMDDVGILETDANSVRGRECGNGVVLRHDNGWTTQYCHLRKDSIVVVKGQTIKKGEPLGEIGLSGLTQFPHVHFEVRNGKKRVDPFVGFEATGKCGTAGAPLFEPAFLEKTPYVETGLLNAGFTDRPPKGIEVLEGEHANDALPADAGALIFWVELFGTHPGDRDRFTIFAPDGSVFTTQTRSAQEGYSARHLAFVGRRRPATGFEIGTYRGVFELLREEVGETKIAFRLERTLQLGDQPAMASPPASTPTPAVTPTSPGTPVTPATPPSASELPPANDATTPQTPAAPEVAQATPEPAAPTLAERAEELLPVTLPAALRTPRGAKGPPPWLIAAALIGVILSMAGIAFITRR
jgi:murein DD-endopeptidase MepM/ murein hydrolase activator NlpD